MYSGYNRIFWGYVITTFHINIGALRILPPFIGFMVIVSGINLLYRSTDLEPFKKAGGIGAIVVVLTLIGEVNSLMFMDSIDILVKESMIAIEIAMEILMVYKCIEGSIIYFRDQGLNEVANNYIGSQRFYIIAAILTTIVLSFNFMFNIAYLIGITAIMFIILRIYLMILFRGLRNRFNN